MSDRLTLLSINQPYPAPLPGQAGAVADFLRPGGNRLLIAIPGIEAHEAKALRTGTLQAGLLHNQGAILWLWQFCDKQGRPVITLDSPFDARVLPDLQHYDITNAEQRLMIDVHIVDSASGLIRGLRGVTMPPALTLEFLSAVQDQLASPGGQQQLSDWMQSQPQDLARQIKMIKMGK